MNNISMCLCSAQRWRQAQLAAAWGGWVERRMHSNHKRQVLLSATQRLQNGSLARAFAAWIARTAAACEKQDRMRAAAQRWAGAVVAAALAQWRDWAAERARNKQLASGELHSNFDLNCCDCHWEASEMKQPRCTIDGAASIKSSWTPCMCVPRLTVHDGVVRAWLCGESFVSLQSDRHSRPITFLLHVLRRHGAQTGQPGGVPGAADVAGLGGGTRRLAPAAAECAEPLAPAGAGAGLRQAQAGVDCCYQC